MEDEESLIAAKAAISALSGKPVDGMTAEEVERNLQKIERHDREEAEEEARMQRMEARAIEEAPAAMPSRLVLRQSRSSRLLRPSRQRKPKRLRQSSRPSRRQCSRRNSRLSRQRLSKQRLSRPLPSRCSPPRSNSAQRRQACLIGMPALRKRPRSPATPRSRRSAPVTLAPLDAAVAESAGHFAKANNIVEHELERSFDIDRDTIREVRAPQWATIAPVQPAVQPETEQPSRERRILRSLRECGVGG